MKSRKQQLTDELLSLYIKYGRAAFLNAVRELREGNITETISAGADALSATAVPTRKSSSPAYKFYSRARSTKLSSKDMLLRYISVLESSRDEIKVRVASLLKRILVKEILASASSLKGYLESIGVATREQKLDRYRAAKKIADYLSDLPRDRAKETIEAIEQMKNTQSSLQQWTDIIVKPDDRQ